MSEGPHEAQLSALIAKWREHRDEICRVMHRCDSAKAFEVQRCADELEALQGDPATLPARSRPHRTRPAFQIEPEESAESVLSAPTWTMHATHPRGVEAHSTSGEVINSAVYRWLTEADYVFQQARAERAEQQVAALTAERTAFLAAVGEESLDDAQSEYLHDAEAWMKVAEDIKSLESWPPNHYPSMQDRWVYQAVWNRATAAEARVEALMEELETLCQAVEGRRAGALTNDGLWHYVVKARALLAAQPETKEPT